jgi:hypothetical protein
LRSVVCPYCGGEAALVDSAEVYGGRSYGMIWLCRPCDAYVGVHRNSKDFAPLGRLADKELRTWKCLAHEAFDRLWNGENGMPRPRAYQIMQKLMGMTPKQAHIGKFDVSQCRSLTEKLSVRGGADSAEEKKG